ncbi:hypothetical protein N7471_004961 [Penicillium samsonianum]|uniref:uncharacterized protein n=1 Tax=Penicillium samsonianum TaxID=1882272 RepID=UPI002547C7DD|nr:uncharacterized protein N7471_004961 [Penicillium samsonianum]KAJ6138475.1 hypothetical protein N7471_004961 [Penicillium samsonianum]
MTSRGPLTAYLLSSTPNALKRATTHPFLASAGRGTLPKAQLSQWLSQDRLYAQSYIRFIGLLLSKIRLPTPNPKSPASHLPTSEQNAITVLIDALVNIRTELAFFEQTANDYTLDLTAISAEEGGCTLTSYGLGSDITVSAGITSTGSGSCPGYAGGEGGASAMSTDATSSAPGHGLCLSQGECQMPSGGEVCAPGPQFNESGRGSEPAAVGGDARGNVGVQGVESSVGLVSSWGFCFGGVGSVVGYGGLLFEILEVCGGVAEFEGFVDRIGDVVDEMAGQIKGAEELEIMQGRCLEWWRQIVWLEENFWPTVAE